ncbi:MAG: N-acetylneuraminate synthase [Wenzhouxiangella sp.]
MTHRTLIIAEAGVNHNGSLEMALELVNRAADAGADLVKFQTFNSARLASAEAPKAGYQNRTTDAAESQAAMLRRLELSAEGHRAVMTRCAELGIGFLSSPFDEGSLALLVGEFGLSRIKLGSGELTNAPLLLASARSRAELILSTGMSTLGEVEEALGVLAFGMLFEQSPQSRADFAAVLTESRAWELLAARVTLLHCTTEYPAPVAQTNLRAMATLQSAFGLSVGYSDHTEGRAISLAAVALGAKVIEKHFTLDRTLPGPDHAASLEPRELAKMVADIRAVESALGTGIKQPGPAELANRAIARKSLHANRDLAKGEVVQPGDLVALRPGDGVTPMDLWDKLGQRCAQALSQGEKLS